MCKTLFRLEVRGVENLPKNGGFIIVSNHVSHLDPPVIASTTMRRVNFLGKMELFKNRWFGEFLRKVHCIPLNRDGIDKTALRIAFKVLNDGGVLGVFPEGTRSLDGKLGPAKGGVSIFAFGTNVPVVPAFISGSALALPPGAHIMRTKKIVVRIGKPFYPPKDFKKEDRKKVYQDFTDKAMQEISKLGQEAT